MNNSICLTVVQEVIMMDDDQNNPLHRYISFVAPEAVGTSKPQ
jgi:hypothetical protein